MEIWKTKSGGSAGANEHRGTIVLCLEYCNELIRSLVADDDKRQPTNIFFPGNGFFGTMIHHKSFPEMLEVALIEILVLLMS